MISFLDTISLTQVTEENSLDLVPHWPPGPEAVAHATAVVGESPHLTPVGPLDMPQGWGNGDHSLNQLDVLIIENDPAAARLTREAFREAGLVTGVRTVRDGDEALAHLRREGAHADHPHPDVIFLDLHLPKKSGLEVLKEIKQNPRLMVTPVVIVSGSEDPQEVREAYELHASCYIRKPDDLHEFLRFIQVCFEFWGSVVTLPPKQEMAAGMA